AYVAVALGVLFVRPKYRAPWLWPDPTRSRVYLDALPPLVVLTATFGGAIVALSATEAIAAAALLPFLSWIAAYHALSPRALAGKWTWTVTIGAGLAALLVAALAWLELPGWRGALVALAGFIAAMTLTTIRRRRANGASPMALPVNVSYGLA